MIYACAVSTIIKGSGGLSPGIRKTRVDIIVFTDDDTICDEEWPALISGRFQAVAGLRANRAFRSSRRSDLSVHQAVSPYRGVNNLVVIPQHAKAELCIVAVPDSCTGPSVLRRPESFEDRPMWLPPPRNCD